MELNRIYNEDCIEGIKRIPEESVDFILTDPPYLYLKKQKLDRHFDEEAFFSQIKRVLKKDGMIALFGRGTSFYRWNTMLDLLGFTFKEEIVWDKGYCTSPLMRVSRVHETVSIYTKGKGSINRVKVPYIEMKKHNIDSIISDVKRLKTCFGNRESFESLERFFAENGETPNKKNIVRLDRNDDATIKFGIIGSAFKTGSRVIDVAQSLEFGMKEKTIIKESRDHHTSIHPTQKPVRLLERLIALGSKEGDIVLDPFMGSGSTAIAALNLSRRYVGFEIDEEYYALATERISKYTGAVMSD